MDLKFKKIYRNGKNGFDTIEFINDKNVIYQIPVKQSVRINEDFLVDKIIRIDNIFTPIEKELQVAK